MKITEVEAIVLRQPGELDATIADGSQDALLIRIHTDAGITGYGEADSLPSVVKAIIDAPRSHKYASGLGSLLVGEDPLQPGPLQRRLYEGSLYYGRRGAVVHAISGLEIALWDIVGKATGKPIHALLGGAYHSRLRAYASTLMPDTPQQVRAVVSAQREAGFAAVKLGYGPLGLDADLDVSLVAAAREAAGDDCDVIIDIGLGWRSARDAIDRVRRMEDSRPYWIEEPFMPDEYGKYAALASAVETPIAAGEQEATAVDFRRLVDVGVEVLQPDVTRVGGILECGRVAELARASGRRCVLHAWSTGIIKAASLHVLAAMPDAELFEYCVQTTELNRRLVTDPFPVSDGYVAIPEGPGLGIEVDEDVVEACRV
ncbi:MAG TPA: mandelate racemase/muconate lactonizing enzyme family protein [Solirubrobacteraceae bacterium]|jgi:L-alanine-DL-glutamate epimerase-like enolase superfamily enzyme|nr:mandelate racemase/muconate lactonizing enzyme family protein [Solirubrobacteraceae bacterium]